MVNEDPTRYLHPVNERPFINMVQHTVLGFDVFSSSSPNYMALKAGSLICFFIDVES